jgi:hypothetical protein
MKEYPMNIKKMIFAGFVLGFACSGVWAMEKKEQPKEVELKAIDKQNQLRDEKIKNLFSSAKKSLETVSNAVKKMKKENSVGFYDGLRVCSGLISFGCGIGTGLLAYKTLQCLSMKNAFLTAGVLACAGLGAVFAKWANGKYYTGMMPSKELLKELNDELNKASSYQKKMEKEIEALKKQALSMKQDGKGNTQIDKQSVSCVINQPDDATYYFGQYNKDFQAFKNELKVRPFFGFTKIDLANKNIDENKPTKIGLDLEDESDSDEEKPEQENTDEKLEEITNQQPLEQDKPVKNQLTDLQKKQDNKDKPIVSQSGGELKNVKTKLDKEIEKSLFGLAPQLSKKQSFGIECNTMKLIEIAVSSYCDEQKELIPSYKKIISDYVGIVETKGFKFRTYAEVSASLLDILSEIGITKNEKTDLKTIIDSYEQIIEKINGVKSMYFNVPGQGDFYNNKQLEDVINELLSALWIKTKEILKLSLNLNDLVKDKSEFEKIMKVIKDKQRTERARNDLKMIIEQIIKNGKFTDEEQSNLNKIIISE